MIRLWLLNMRTPIVAARDQVDECDEAHGLNKPSRWFSALLKTGDLELGIPDSSGLLDPQRPSLLLP